jgi:hypothetical protein
MGVKQFLAELDFYVDTTIAWKDAESAELCFLALAVCSLYVNKGSYDKPAEYVHSL